MLNFCLMSICLLSAQILCSQQDGKSPSVISVAGTVSKSDQITLEWTLGETFVQTLAIDKGYHTQGYHQPQVKVIEFSKDGALSYDIIIFPNPAKEILNVSIKTLQKDKLKIKMTDVTGRNILSQNAPGGSTDIQLKTKELPEGIYMLSVINEQGFWIRSFKIIKHS